MRAEIVTTGTELLLGQIDDTNATYLARQLRDLGIDIYFRTTVGDNEERIAQALSLALSRADVIITTGGLGPTVDDVTREAVAKATDRPLVLHPDLLDQIDRFFRRLGRKMSDNNRRQAYVPTDCIPVENPVGTAPAFIVEHEQGTIITLPGVPREMRYLMEHAIVPYLQQRLGQHHTLVTRILRTVAMGESSIDEAIADLEMSTNPTVGLSAHAGQTDVRIVAKAATKSQAEAMIADTEAKIRERLGAAIYATGNATLEAVLVDLLQARKRTLAVGETLTGGAVAQRMSAYPDAFGGAVVAPNSASLARRIGLHNQKVDGQQGAELLAEGVRQAWGTNLGLCIAGDEEHGLWVAIASPDRLDTRRLRYRGRDRRAQIWTTTLALEFLRRLLLGLADDWTP